MHYKHSTPEMHYRTTLRVQLIHVSILPSLSPSCKPLGPFGSLSAELFIGIRPHGDFLVSESGGLGPARLCTA